MKSFAVRSDHLLRSLQLARSKPRHVVGHPSVSSVTLRTGPGGVLDSLRAIQPGLFGHAMPNPASLGSLYQLSNCLTKPAPPKKAASDVLNSEVSLENRLHERFYRFHCGDATSPKLDFVLTSRPSIPPSRPSGCGLPQPEAERSLFNFGMQAQPGSRDEATNSLIPARFR